MDLGRLHSRSTEGFEDYGVGGLRQAERRAGYTVVALYQNHGFVCICVIELYT